MNAESPTGITNERAADLLCIAAHWIGHLCDGEDPLTFSELLVVIAGAAGLAASNLPMRDDRDRVLANILRLAERTAEDARSPDPIAPAVARLLKIESNRG
jgi:hypothetical protein